MKKIITVLMVLMIATSMFAKTKILFNSRAEECVICTDTLFKQMEGCYDGFSVEEIIEYVDTCFSKFYRTKGYNFKISKHSIEQTDKYAKKYYIYWVNDYSLNWVRYIIKLDNDKQLVIYCTLQQTK